MPRRPNREADQVGCTSGRVGFAGMTARTWRQRRLGRRHGLFAPDAVPPGSPARYMRGTSEVYRRSMPRLTTLTLRTSRSQAVSPAAYVRSPRCAPAGSRYRQRGPHRPDAAMVRSDGNDRG